MSTLRRLLFASRADFRRARKEEKNGGRSRNAASSSPVGCPSAGGRGQVERRIRTVARIQWKVMNTRSSKTGVSYLKPPLRSAMPLSVARIYVGIPLVAMKVKTPRSARERWPTAYRESGCSIAHGAVALFATLLLPPPPPPPRSLIAIRLGKMDHQINRRASDTRGRFRRRNDSWKYFKRWRWRHSCGCSRFRYWQK